MAKDTANNKETIGAGSDSLLAQLLLDQHQRLETKKNVWLPLYELVGQFIMYRKQNFTSDGKEGEFLTTDLYDTTAADAANTMASAFLGQLWPDSARSVVVTPPAALENDEEAKAYFQKVSKAFTQYMDDPRSGQAVALSEYMLDSGSFGTAGIAVFDNDEEVGSSDGNASYECPINFRAWDVKSMLIDEDFNGRVDTVFNKQKYSYKQLVDKYGENNIPQEIKDKYGNTSADVNKDTSVQSITVLHILTPRKYYKHVLKNKLKHKSVLSIHLLVDSKTILRLKGFDDMPVIVGRFFKVAGEIQGRSPGIACLPAALQLNDAWRMVTDAADKQLNPPMAVEDSSVLGGGILDTSAGAVNVFNNTGRISSTRTPVNPLYTVGEYQTIGIIEEKLKAIIEEAFMLDRLLDFKSKTEMTAYETNVRDRIRGETLSSVFARQMSEVFYPMLTRAYNALFSKGLLGIRETDTAMETQLRRRGIEPFYIPDRVMELIDAGVESYQLKFISPAVRMMQAEQRQNLTGLIDFALAAEQNGLGGIADNLDPDKTFAAMTRLMVLPVDITRTKNEVEGVRKVRAEQAQMQLQLEMAKTAAAANMQNAQADAQRMGSSVVSSGAKS